MVWKRTESEDSQNGKSRPRGHGPRILLAEDDDANRHFLASVLSRNGYQVTSCSSGTELLDWLGAQLIRREPFHFDLIISDIRMPGMTGMEILEGLGDYDACPPIILFTAFGGPAVQHEAYARGAAAFFVKPFDPQDLLAKARELTPPDHQPGSTRHGPRGPPPA